jgi:sigma-E factor negative regulatory protein RseA
LVDQAKVNTMSYDELSLNERISALVDGQLRGDAVTQAVQTLAQDAEARASWYVYHLVGDVLRSEELSLGCAKDRDFLSRLRNRLQDEAQPLLPETAIDSVAVYVGYESTSSIHGFEKEAANDTGMRWKWIAGLASLVCMAVLGWRLLDGLSTPASPPQWAQTEPASVAVQDASAPIMIRDPRLDQLLQAHQQFGGVSALQMPSGFLRNATFERPAP